MRILHANARAEVKRKTYHPILWKIYYEYSHQHLLFGVSNWTTLYSTKKKCRLWVSNMRALSYSCGVNYSTSRRWDRDVDWSFSKKLCHQINVWCVCARAQVRYAMPCQSIETASILCTTYPITLIDRKTTKTEMKTNHSTNKFKRILFFLFSVSVYT